MFNLLNVNQDDFEPGHRPHKNKGQVFDLPGGKLPLPILF